VGRAVERLPPAGAARPVLQRDPQPRAVVERPAEARPPVHAVRQRVVAGLVHPPGEEVPHLLLALRGEVVEALSQGVDNGSRIRVERVRVDAEADGLPLPGGVRGERAVDRGDRALGVVEALLEVLDERRTQQGGQHLLLLGVEVLRLGPDLLREAVRRGVRP